MFWRGVVSTSADRAVLINVTKDHPEVADIMDMNWGALEGSIPANYVSADRMCLSKYIIYTEGDIPFP